MAPIPPATVAEPIAESTISVNFLSDLGKARHGSEISANFSSLNAFIASSGRGPPFHAVSFLVNFVRGFEIRLKFLTCVRKKFANPRNCLI